MGRIKKQFSAHPQVDFVVLESFQSKKEIKGLRGGIYRVRPTCLRAPHRQASDPTDCPRFIRTPTLRAGPRFR